MLRALTLRRSVQSHHHHNNLRAVASTTFPQNPLNPPPSSASTCATPSSSCSAPPPPTTPSLSPKTPSIKKAQIFRYAPLPEDLHTVSNWSRTHEVQTRVFHQPETLEELEKVVKDAHEKKTGIRPVGSGLSPNGIGLSGAGMVNLALMDKVLEVDKEKKRVRVQAGIRVQQLVDGIKEHGITLQNLPPLGSSRLVGAHGTGSRLPPIDEQVISMKMVTPAKGTLEVSKEKDPELFYLARCGLGGLGVVAEVTIQCVDRQELVEHTTVSTLAEIKKNRPPKFKPKYSSDEAIQHVRNLYRECLQKYRVVPDKSEVDINELSFTELRDKLLALDPLDKDHVVKVNQAEAEFWKKLEGYRVGWSDEILGFDCGGQQWVSETCFLAGTLAKPSMKDLEYIEGLKQLIEKVEIPAPAPIEQLWTACTKSPMSPASSTREDDIFSWVPKDKDELAALQDRLRKRFPVDAYNKA
ncbi:hypothetical protein C1H46_008540 [Malus baccata]|uniref:FAD-binding PCMH-type domain-containing protein n=1 Tax=Malus baccata TaxID=106549 RepID=A0A540N469_MALBA|nr:hypothetical protein C1H46_008540 [Malus baccata]